MNFRVAVLASAFFLSACGGRASEIVSIERESDTLLSCEHLAAEYRVNASRIPELQTERSNQNGNNVGLLLVAPLFLDFSDTEKKEIEALKQRNNRLLGLMQQKSCEALHSDVPDFDNIESDATQ
ncbi:MAG: hypothetical protein JJ850_01010 [Kordiimonadaceae bacterium]|nr:hypothetical protein [Kordiimonadaceae bacterium]MBO6567620.1 hypothetical protein [Kordiimonadaceae bacterium]MBO6963166.1 hypothetical protein [Kordiimonadaceae bacterium]